jgi:hypothetical protein
MTVGAMRYRGTGPVVWTPFDALNTEDADVVVAVFLDPVLAHGES